MANGENITTKFKVDISDLKAGITEANKEIKLANAQFKAASAGMDDWTKSAEGINAKLRQLDTVLAAQNSKLSNYRDQLARVNAASEENEKRAAELRAKLQELTEKGVSKTSAEYKTYQKALADCEKEQISNEKAADSLKITILNQEAAVNSTEREIRTYENSLNALDTQQEEVAKSAEKAGDGFTVMKGALASLVADGIRAAINGLKDMAKASYEAWQSYDDGADTIIAATGATGKAAEKLIGVYEDVAKNVVGDFNDIGTAVGEVNIRFGLTGKGLQTLSEKFIKFADINGLDVKTAIDNTQSALAAFGLKAEDAGDLLDVLNKAGQDTGVSLDSLTQQLVANAPALQEMGFNASDSAMFLANLSKNGVDASSVMGGMKKALATAAKEGKPMSQAMSEIEKSIKNAKTPTDAINKAIELFGTKAGPAIATAVRDGKLSFEDFGTTLTDFQGNVETTYNEMLDGPDQIALAMQNLKLETAKVFDAFLKDHAPQLESVINGFTSKVLPAVTKILGKIADGIGWIIDHGDEITTVLTALAVGVASYVAYTTALTIMTKGWMALEVAQKAAAVAQKVVNTVMAANPIGLVIAAVAALVVVLAKLIKALKNEEKAIKTTQKAQEDLTNAKKAAEEAENAYVSAVDRAEEAQKALAEAEKKSGISGAELYKQVQAGTLDYANMTEQQKEVYKAYLENDAAQKQVKESTEALTKAKKDETIASFENDLAIAKEKGSYDEYKASVVDAYNKGILSAEEARDLIGAAMSEMSRDSQKTFMEDIPGDITAGLEPTQYETKGQQLTKWFGEKWADIKTFFNEAPGWFGRKFGEAWESIKRKFSEWGSYWSGLWEKVKEKFTGLGTKIGEGISGAVKAGINKVISMIENTINRGIRLINSAINLINKLPGVNIGKVKELSLPRLAKGGVLAKGQVGLLEGSGAEAVVPLDQNKRWIRAVAADLKRELQTTSSSTRNLTNNNVQNFTQNIYAPKQPSRIELYRQTRNLLAYAKGEV